MTVGQHCSAPACRHWSALQDHHSAKNSMDFDHEINSVEKNVGAPAILGRTLGQQFSSFFFTISFLNNLLLSQ
jgi:hypothetical protein